MYDSVTGVHVKGTGSSTATAMNRADPLVDTKIKLKIEWLWQQLEAHYSSEVQTLNTQVEACLQVDDLNSQMKQKFYEDLANYARETEAAQTTAESQRQNWVLAQMGKTAALGAAAGGAIGCVKAVYDVSRRKQRSQSVKDKCLYGARSTTRAGCFGAVGGGLSAVANSIPVVGPLANCVATVATERLSKGEPMSNPEIAASAGSALIACWGEGGGGVGCTAAAAGVATSSMPLLVSVGVGMISG